MCRERLSRFLGRKNGLADVLSSLVGTRSL